MSAQAIEHYPGAPRFFVRAWNGGDVQLPRVPIVEGLVVIYGYSQRSSYPEDRVKEDRSFAGGRGSFPSQCFSSICPEGEWGFTPMSDVVEIGEEEFNAARERGWKSGQ